MNARPVGELVLAFMSDATWGEGDMSAAFRSERRTYGARVFAVTVRREDGAVVAWAEVEPPK